MAKTKFSNLEKKKQELEQELVRIQEDLDKSIDDVKEGVSYSLDPKNIVKKYPLSVVGTSLVIGFLLGRERKSSGSVSRYSRNDSTSAISSELKRILAKKGLSMLLDYLDNKVAELKKEKETNRD